METKGQRDKQLEKRIKAAVMLEKKLQVNAAQRRSCALINCNTRGIVFLIRREGG